MYLYTKTLPRSSGHFAFFHSLYLLMLIIVSHLVQTYVLISELPWALHLEFGITVSVSTKSTCITNTLCWTAPSYDCLIYIILCPVIFLYNRNCPILGARNTALCAPMKKNTIRKTEQHIWSKSVIRDTEWTLTSPSHTASI